MLRYSYAKFEENACVGTDVSTSLSYSMEKNTETTFTPNVVCDSKKGTSIASAWFVHL